MRLATRNCCAGPVARKLEALAPFAADIAVVPESPRLPSTSPRARWFGENPRKGLAVLAAEGWRLTPVRTTAPLPRYIVPIQVRGPVDFLLIAVWAKSEGADRYVRGVVRGIQLLRRRMAMQPTIVLGDLNSNAIWDDEHPKDRSHSALVRSLDEAGLVSAYHTWHGEAHGAERRPTFFEYRHVHRPYHLDYCFIPKGWQPRLREVHLGTHADWSHLSDHVPLVCDIGELP